MCDHAVVCIVGLGECNYGPPVELANTYHLTVDSAMKSMDEAMAVVDSASRIKGTWLRFAGELISDNVVVELHYIVGEVDEENGSDVRAVLQAKTCPITSE